MDKVDASMDQRRQLMAEQGKQIAIEWVEAHKPLLVDTHQFLWQNPEVGLQELKAGKRLADILEEHGFAVERGVAGMPSAFVATYGSGSPLIGMMAELDALPELSQKAVPYREPAVEGGAGHGCGHCGYATAALGGALAAKAAMEALHLPGTIKCFGCPAEETLVGKVFMVRDGIFDGLDACLGHHPGSTNSVGLGSGNAMNSVKFEFYGKASHAGGSPEQGISALDAVELMNIGVNYMREHVVQETRMHYVIEAGGHEPNVVPAYARSWYYVRAPTRELVEQYYAWVLKIAEGADLMARTTHKVRFLT
ncbi:MAG: amidohydrolase, partial [Anaerolineae bacterium]|nr:amidohydrolase [Anaerolineae bacterium]